MKQLKNMVAVVGAFALLPQLGAAQSVQDQIVSQLQAQGFTRIEISRTLLGRVRIEAESNTLERELVFNPTTGEILRDYWERRDGRSASPRISDPSRDSDDDEGSDNRTSGSNQSDNGSTSGNSSRGSDDEDDDDDRDDDDEDDRDEEDDRDDDDEDDRDDEDDDDDDDDDED